ncbi:MAG: DNA/RNA non-specific endonuclease [Ginsengibacter sp.]
MFISVAQLDESAKRFTALDETPIRDKTSDFSEEALIADVSSNVTEGNIIGTDENLIKRKEMLEAIKQEPVDFAFERAIGKNDSVYSNFVELIRNAKQKVGRIFIKSGNKKIGYATGFMVAENLMLTNWHVFKTIEDVADSEIQFFYEYDIFGNEGIPTSFKLQSNVFYHSNKELDYCLVAVNLIDISGTKRLSDIGYIYLDPALGKLGSEDEEALNIIHHPDGDFKQLSIRENLFVKITPTSIWYQTDTAPGSSGSPVFNDQWQVVALHHMGVGRKNEAGEYIDKDGKVIPKLNGKIDASKVVWDANEGIRISVILKDLFISFPDTQILKGLQVKPGAKVSSEEQKPGTDKPTTSNNNSNNSNMESNNPTNSVNISFPSSLVEKNGVVNISINQGGYAAAKPTEKTLAVSTVEELDLAEIKKLEETTDFSACKGYQSRFLGSNFNISLPQPQQLIRKFIAKVGGTDSLVLKYYNYSTIFHSVRMMPIISGINVDGDPKKRKDNTPRKDVWLRDTRLSFDIQLSDTYYKGSGFDRGHMSRREDANWGSNPEDAKRNADLTCMYTNACPQVAKINQSGKRGLWGILEKIVLESGAIVEKGKTAKITVFNGPIFKEDDPVFRGIQVPMDFYKIVLWLTDDGNLKATAFKLSQVELVSDIDFEQLDLDQNTEFKEFQCSIKSLQKETKIDFSAIVQFDTFEGNEGEEVALNSELEVMAHISRHNEV